VSLDFIKELPALAREKMIPEKTGLVYSIYLGPEQIVPATLRLYKEECYLEDISVIDTADGFQVVYHFNHFVTPGRIALRIMIAHEKPECPSISEIFTGADWHEREAHDFYGVVFTGHKNLVPLLLPDDANIHPLVKEPAQRKKVGEIMTRGEVEFTSPEIEALLNKPEKREEAKPVKAGKAAGEETGEKASSEA
jgi:NADH-quinone oxidoreductase subunit C